MHKKGGGLKAVIVAPTRELVIQLYKEFLMFCNVSNKSNKSSNQLTNDQPKSSARVKFLRKALTPKTQDQFDDFCKSCEILISTPLKLAQLTDKFNFDNIEHLVIDEADKMFELGFLEQIDTILANCKNNQRISKFLFSATMQPGIEEVVRQVMTNSPLKVQIGIKNATASTV